MLMMEGETESLFTYADEEDVGESVYTERLFTQTDEGRCG